MVNRKKYIINGRIIDIKTKQSLAGLRVEAWDKDLLIDDLISNTRTDRRGHFKMEFSTSYFSELFTDRNPDLYFKIFHKDKLIKSTEKDILWNVDLGGEDIIIELEIPFEIKENNARFRVRGRITIGDKVPVQGVLVKAFNQTLKRQLRLGETTANRNGEYEIHYETKHPHDLCLIVGIYEPEKGKEIGSSAIIFGVKEEEVIDVSIDRSKYRGPSESERLFEVINIERENIAITDLSEKQIEYIAGKTGSDPISIKLVQDAQKFADETSLPVEMFYAFGKQDITLSMDSILTQNHQTLRRAFEAAVAENVIPERFDKSVDELFEKLQEYTANKELKGESPKGALLLTSKKLTNKQREAYLITYSQYDAPSDEFWEELSKHPEFKGNGGIEEIKLTFQMGELTKNYLPLVIKLQEYHLEGTLQRLKDLAQWDHNKWAEVINKVGAPPGIPGEIEHEKAESYIDSLQKFIDTAYPTAVIVREINREEKPIPGVDVLRQFLQENQDFELGKTNIDSYLDEDAEGDLRTQLKSWQRVYMISPMHGRYDVMRELIKEGLDSAQAIIRMGPGDFVNNYSDKLGGKEKVQEVWDKSSRVASIAFTILARYCKAFSVTPEIVPSLVAIETDTIPNWGEFFGSQNFCDCEHCKSVLGRHPVPPIYYIL